MENTWFIWQTNSDYADMLRRPEIRTDREIRRAEMKREQSKTERRRENRKRKKIRKIYFIMK